MGGTQKVFGVGDGDQFGAVHRPVDAVDDDGRVGGDFFAEGGDVAFRVLLVFSEGEGGCEN